MYTIVSLRAANRGLLFHILVASSDSRRAWRASPTTPPKGALHSDILSEATCACRRPGGYRVILYTSSGCVSSRRAVGDVSAQNDPPFALLHPSGSRRSDVRLGPCLLSPVSCPLSPVSCPLNPCPTPPASPASATPPLRAAAIRRNGPARPLGSSASGRRSPRRNPPCRRPSPANGGHRCSRRSCYRW
jgi:hypothetical protein